MRTLFDYLRLITFFAAALLGVQLPGLVEQYGQNLAAREAEASLALEPFRQDAERYVDGDMDALIARYRRSGDPLVTDGGKSIAQLLQRHRRLETALTRYQNSAWSAWWQAFIAPIPDVREQVLEQYSYNVKLAPAAIGIGLMIGLLAAMLLEASTRGCAHACGKAWHKLRRKRHAHAPPPRRPPRIS